MIIGPLRNAQGAETYKCQKVTSFALLASKFFYTYRASIMLSCETQIQKKKPQRHRVIHKMLLILLLLHFL